MLTDRDEGLSEGYPYPMLSKVVESVIENMQIEARLQQNEQAIADMEAVIDPGLPATLNRIEGELGDQDRKMRAFSTNIEQALLDIEATMDPELPATLNRIEGELGDQDRRIDSIEAINIGQALFDIEAAMDPELPTTLNRIDGTLVDQNNRLNYLEAIDFVEMNILQDSMQSIYTSIGNFYYNKSYCDKYFTRNDALDVRLLSYMRTDDLGSYLDLKLNRADFDSFLMGKMTQETIDQIAFSLADVDVNGVSMNLGTALEDRPSFAQVPGIEFNSPYRKDRGQPALSLTDWINKVQDNEQFKVERDTLISLPSTWYPSLGTMPLQSGDPAIWSWIRMIAENDKRLNELPEIPDLPDIGGMITCFTGGDATLKNLTSSLNGDIGVLSIRLNDLKTRMNNVKDYYEDLRVKLQAIRDKITGPGISKETMQEILDAFTFFASNLKDFFGSMSSSMDDASQKMGTLSQRASDLKNCGSTNLDW